MSPSVHRRSPIRRRSPDRSDSPVRGRSPPRRRGSPRKERSPPRHRSSPRRERSPARYRSSPRPRSPVRTPRSPARTGSSHRIRSPAREKNSVRDTSPKYARSSSPVSQSPSPHSKRLRRAQVERENSKAMERGRSTSPALQSPSPRTKRLRRAQAERQMEKVKESSPVSQSPSPRTKRLRRAQAEREADKVERKREGHNSRDGDKGRHRDRGVDKELSAEKRLMQDKNDVVSSKSRETRHGRSNSPSERGHKSRYSSHSPSRSSKGAARDEESRARVAERRDIEYDDSMNKMKVAEEALEAKEKQKPSFELSGKLAAETNRVRGVTLLFNEPPDARKPDVRWRLYVFKAGEVLNEPLYVHRQSCYLFGRERRVADIPTDHPSCSKQHAVIQFRLVEKELPDGMMSKQVRPYIMDLGSTNGTFINDNRVEPQRYYELFEKDTVKFGNSSREYVLLHENSVE